MLITLPEILDQQQLAFIKDCLSQGEFTDGRASAGNSAAANKNNQEYETSVERMQELNNLVMGALIRHPVYLNAGLPL